MAAATSSPPSAMDQMKTISRTKSLNKLSQPRTAPNQGPENTTIQVPNRTKSINEPSRPVQSKSPEPTNQMLFRMKSLNNHSRPRLPSQNEFPSKTQSLQQASQPPSRSRAKTTSHPAYQTSTPTPVPATSPPNFSHPHPNSTTTKGKYSTIKNRAQAFCSAFLDPATNPPERILSDHFQSDAEILEHGPTFAQAKLPHIARPFRGHNEGLWYFRLQSETVEFLPSENTFVRSESNVVDPEAVVPGVLGRGIATIVAKAKFRAVKTGQSWEASVCWRLSGFDEEGRIGRWEVWGDCLSAWIAVGSGGGTPF